MLNWGYWGAEVNMQPSGEEGRRPLSVLEGFSRFLLCFRASQPRFCMCVVPQIQGAILVSSLLQLLLGFSGLVGLVLRFIGPLAIAPTINLIGLSLFIEAGKKCGTHWGIAAL